MANNKVTFDYLVSLQTECLSTLQQLLQALQEERQTIVLERGELTKEHQIIEEEKRELVKEKLYLKKEKEGIEREKEVLKAKTSNCCNTSSAASTSKCCDDHNVIKLNVGGTTFTTSVATLTSDRAMGSYFEALISKHQSSGDCSENSIFIDRDPTMFRYILNYLRGDRPDLSLLSISEQNNLVHEATFYNLLPLTSSILPSQPSGIFSPGMSYTLDETNTIATYTTPFWWYSVMGPEIKPNCIATTRIVATKSSFLFIGIAPTTIDPTKANNHRQGGCGWYFSCYYQNLYAGMVGIEEKEYDGLRGELPVGSRVGVKLQGNGDVSFVVNDKEHSVAYNIPVGVTYRLVVIMYHSGDSVQLL